jgi:hypothetical protein
VDHAKTPRIIAKAWCAINRELIVAAADVEQLRKSIYHVAPPLMVAQRFFNTLPKHNSPP